MIMARKTKTAKIDDGLRPALGGTRRRFKICSGREITYPKPYEKAGKYRTATEGDVITTDDIPVGRCLEFVAEDALAEVGDE